LCPHLKRITLVDVGLTDEDVGDLVDAFRVNSSIQHLDLSHNRLEDIGARVLAILVKPSAGSSSRLRSLCLQHNQIGEFVGRVLGHCASQ
jgi:Ran GTPase-activating protein (RanGAP) involved in mRNA processing and transport